MLPMRDERQKLKIELLSQWKLEAESRKKKPEAQSQEEEEKLKWKKSGDTDDNQTS